MKSDIASGVLGPRKKRAATATANPLASVAQRSVGELRQDLSSLLRSAQPNRSLSEMAKDGTPSIPSLVAVWLISQVAAAAQKPKLVNLSKVRPEELRSLGGLAALLHRSLHQTMALAS